MHKIEIAGIQSGSIAEELGIEAGDFLISINGQEIVDVFDYRFYCADSELTLGIEKKNGEFWEFEIEKDEMEDIGLEFVHSLLDEEKSCRNKCVFCFIDQLPKGMRNTLYFKDDDARLSFLYGNYITMTNLTDAEIDRIIRYRMSPVNISVHTTNPELRKKMLNNRFAGDVLEKLKRFAEGGLMLNCQIVLVPDYNDGEELDRTIDDITSIGPQVHSISVVPVGLTRYREGLAKLRPFDKEMAFKVVKQVENSQEKLMKKYGSRTVYLGDEFYIMAGLPFPPVEAYEDFPQIENGVGMVVSFMDEVDEVLTDLKKTKPVPKFKTVSIATGVSFYPFMEKISEKIEEVVQGLKINVYPIENNFFGKGVTVTGLLTGCDLEAQLTEKALGERLLLTKNMFRSGTATLLDDMTADELEDKLGTKIQIVDNSGQAFLEHLVQSL